MSSLGTYRLPNSVQVLVPNSDKNWGKAEFKIDADQAVVALEVRCTARITAAGGYGGGAISTTNRDALLNGIFVDLSTGGADGEPRTEALQNVSLKKLMRMQEQLLERELYGYGDATTGLAKPPVAGTTTTHVWRSLIPFDVEFIEPGSLYGMGPSQFNTLQMQIRMGADPLTAAVATLSITDITIELWARVKQTNGDQVMPLIHLREKTDPGKLGIAFGDCMPLVLEDTNNPLATTDIAEVTVKIGDEVVTKPPATPADINEQFLDNPNVGDVEDTSEYSTDLYRNADTQIGKMRTGPISVEQRVQNEDLQLRLTFFPVMGPDTIFRDIRAAALLRRPGSAILAVSNAALQTLNVESRHLPFLPYTMFEAGERQAEQYAGLRCVYGGQPEVYIPPYLLDAAAVRYINAAAENNGAGNNGVMLDTIRSVADMVPGSVISGRGYKGGVSPVYAEVERQVLARVQQMIEQAQGRS